MPDTSTVRATVPVPAAAPVFSLSASALARSSAAVVAVPVLKGSETDAPVLGPGAADFDDAFDLLAHLEAAGATGKAGETVRVVLPTHPTVDVLWLVGVGSGSTDDYRRAGAALARAVRGVDHLATTIAADSDAALTPFVVGFTLGSFRHTYKSTAPWFPAKRVTLHAVPKAQQPRLDRAVAVARASWLSRELASVPSSIKNPAWLADRAVAVAVGAGLDVTVWDEKRLAKEGFGGIVAVGKGSVSPPRFVRLDYTPKGATERTPTVVLVGKGITFDTGGLNIKPGDGMKTMKRDMTGAGVVLAVMSALAEVGCPIRVTGLLACAENAVSGSAMRPSDVITHWNGRTTEIGNTDAEGRLVLADALGYAVSELKPAAVVDIATLTGAIKVSLGQSVAGLFSNCDALADALLAAGGVAGEKLWRMPLASVYEEKLASRIADSTNDSGTPGAITAALFLQHFVKPVTKSARGVKPKVGAKAPPWAHLDIASVGDARKDEYEWTEGPTGFGARVLLEWLGAVKPLAGV